MKGKFATLVILLLLATGTVRGSTTGSIVGIVTDPTGAVIPGAAVVALNVETGVQNSIQTNTEGFYSFPALPIGHYTIQVKAKGFSDFQETGLVLDVNSALRVDAMLRVGTVSANIAVSATIAHVDTQSTVIGEVIGAKEMEDLPLNGRDWTGLMALQPGVVPYSVAAVEAYSPGISEGTLSINGARESANGFTLNGGNVQEPMAGGVSVVPNLDSLAEFRILTDNFDAEYGHYNGGVITLVTKSGTNKFHGDAYEFLENTKLDARNFYTYDQTNPVTGAEIPGSAIGAWKQNQFGGTLGGPIARDKVFFFADYEGLRSVAGGSGFTLVPSAADRNGNLADEAQYLTGSVTGPAFANSLSQHLGYPVSVGEPFYTSGCTTATCVFPNAVIPRSAFSPLSVNLMKFIPLPNLPPEPDFPTGAYANSGPSSNTPWRENKGGYRVDANTRGGMLSGYYHIDDWYTFLPDAFTVGAIGSSVNHGRSSLITFGDTKTFGPSSVNEFRLSFMRNAAVDGIPASAGVFGAGDLSSLGWTVGCNTLGICLTSPNFGALPTIGLNNFGFGGPAGPRTLDENTYQVSDDYSKVVGTHSLKFGGIYSLTQANLYVIYEPNGGFGFNGEAETGLDFADFLLGAPIWYSQGQIEPQYNRARYYGVFAQDSWRVRRNLTLNYGLRWDVTTPWWGKDNLSVNVLVPGLQSQVFPGAPTGWVFPGDTGIPSTVAPTRYGNVAPRLGLAYSPDPHGNFWHKLTGGAGKTSIRGGGGMFYTDLEGWTNGNEAGDAPFGFWWQSPTPAMFATPFVDLYTGHSEGQRYPAPFAPLNVSAAHPDPNVNWAQFEPISSSPSIYYRNVIPYSDNFMFSIQRQFGAATLLTVNYVGTRGHHLMVIEEANPATPSVCLSVSQPSEVAPGSNTCGPYSESGTFTTTAGQVIEARQQLGPNGGTDFGSDGWFKSIGHSNYNALEVSVRRTVGRMTLLAGYTYSKSMDIGSGSEFLVYPFNPNRSWALSAFDMTHNFVVSYSYELPFDKAFGRVQRLARGWIVTGITRFATGLPVGIAETDDRSLIGDTSTGPTGDADEPNFTPGRILLNTNPRKGGTYFNTSLFSEETLGQYGNSSGAFFHGPGTNNWDLALHKDVHLTESKTLEFRGEFFNIFNHTQFYGPDGNIDAGPMFGVISGAGSPRVGQVAIKFLF